MHLDTMNDDESAVVRGRYEIAEGLEVLCPRRTPGTRVRTRGVPGTVSGPMSRKGLLPRTPPNASVPDSGTEALGGPGEDFPRAVSGPARLARCATHGHVRQARVRC